MIFTYSIPSGYHYLSIPCTLPVVLTAESLILSINSQGGTCTEVQRWIDGGWESHPIGLPFNNFEIVPGVGYAIVCTGPSTWTISGDWKLEGITYSLNALTLLGIPAIIPLLAQDFLDCIRYYGGLPVEIIRYIDGGQESHPDGLPFNNFEIEATWGYFVQVSAPITITIEQIFAYLLRNPKINPDNVISSDLRETVTSSGFEDPRQDVPLKERRESSIFKDNVAHAVYREKRSCSNGI